VAYSEFRNATRSAFSRSVRFIWNRWLEKAYHERSNEMVSLKVSPAYDFLRNDPRFHLLGQAGLAQ